MTRDSTSSEAVKVHNRLRLKQIERQAEGYLELGMAQQALETLARLARHVDLTAHGYYLRGEALRSLDRYAEALAPLGEAARRSTGKAIHVWLALAWCHKRTGELLLAIEDMERALQEEPNEALLHYNLACYLSLVGNKRRALGHLARAFSLGPEYRALVDAETDFDPLRSDPQFQALTRSRPSPA